jgi:hypothetical protein
VKTKKPSPAAPVKNPFLEALGQWRPIALQASGNYCGWYSKEVGWEVARRVDRCPGAEGFELEELTKAIVLWCDQHGIDPGPFVRFNVAASTVFDAHTAADVMPPSDRFYELYEEAEALAGRLERLCDVEAAPAPRLLEARRPISDGMTISAATREALVRAGFQIFPKRDKKRMLKERYPTLRDVKGRSLTRKLNSFGVKWCEETQEYLAPPPRR